MLHPFCYGSEKIFCSHHCCIITHSKLHFRNFQNPTDWTSPTKSYFKPSYCFSVYAEDKFHVSRRKSCAECKSGWYKSVVVEYLEIWVKGKKCIQYAIWKAEKVFATTESFEPPDSKSTKLHHATVERYVISGKNVNF